MIKKAKPIKECNEETTDLVIYRVPAIKEYNDEHGMDIIHRIDKWDLYKSKDIIAERNSIAKEFIKIAETIRTSLNTDGAFDWWKEADRITELAKELKE